MKKENGEETVEHNGAAREVGMEHEDEVPFS